MSDRPHGVAGRPGVSGLTTDVLSDVLRSVRLSGATYFDNDLSAPWVAESPPAHEVAQRVLPGSQRVIEYHLVAEGTCWAQRVGDEPIVLQEGDLVVFPQGDAHVLSSAPGLRGAVDIALFDRPPTLPRFVRAGGGGARTRIVCCFLGCDELPYNPLLGALPRVLHLPAARRSGDPGRLRALMDMAVAECRRAAAGSDNVLARLAELMFVEAIRQYLEALPPAETGWLAALRDPVIGRALQRLHAAPREPWTVERLAREVGLSRSVLAERFTEAVGHPPIQYLALWRMQLASQLLAAGETVAAAAETVGYESEAAFSRAFKKQVGHPPSTWKAALAR